MDQRIDFNLLSKRRQEIGISSKVTVWNWKNGARPEAHSIPKIASVLGMAVSDVVDALWGEKIGDPCPCSCGGKKVFSLKWPHTRMLAIEIPCECGVPRIRKRYPEMLYHLQLCRKCLLEQKRELSKVEFTCPGYYVCETHLWAPTCPRKKQFGPRELGCRRYAKAHNPNSRFDEANRTWQCGACSNLERLWSQRKDELLKHLAEKHPGIELGRIRTFDDVKQLQSEHTRCIRPKLLGTDRAILTSRPRRSGYSAPGVTIAHLKRYWSGPPETWPKNERFSLCNLCGFLTRGDKQKIQKFHDHCYHETQSPGAGILSSKRGRPVTEESLKTSWAWTIQYFLVGRPFDDIAKKNGVHFTSVRGRIEFLVDRLKPELLRQHYRRDVEIILDAYRKSRRTVQHAEINPTDSIERAAGI